jgi:hypothetical protein
MTDWATILAPDKPMSECLPYVEEAALSILHDAGIRSPQSTESLAALIWPEARKGSGTATSKQRWRLASALMHLAQHGLSEYATRGPVEYRRDKPIRRWQWRVPVAKEPEVDVRALVRDLLGLVPDTLHAGATCQAAFAWLNKGE